MAFKLLEINLISAYDLDPPRSLSSHDRIYAVVWIDPNQKLKSSIVERETTTSPSTWNERFVFIVDDNTLKSLTTAHLVVELYSVQSSARRRDVLVGTSRVLLGTLGNCGRHYSGKSTGSFREFCVRRRPDGVPRGVLNVGFTVLDGLAISDEQLVKAGSAIDCEKLARRTDQKGVVAVTRELFGRLLLRRTKTSSRIE